MDLGFEGRVLGVIPRPPSARGLEVGEMRCRMCGVPKVQVSEGQYTNMFTYLRLCVDCLNRWIISKK